MNELAIRTDSVLSLNAAEKNRLSRLRMYEGWIAESRLDWLFPDLATYRDYLLHDRGLAPASVAAHLSTIRARYSELLRDNGFRDRLYQQALGANPADKKAQVDELITRIQNAINPKAATVKTVKIQDTADDKHLRLTVQQANALLMRPGTDTLKGLRDTAVIALMLATGLREQELCNLIVSDLYQHMNGEAALLIREGKGAKQRLVPYGDMIGARSIVEKWLKAAGISEGIVFRGFYQGKRAIRHTRLDVRSVQRVLEDYQLTINGKQTYARPHDLRRTYARRLYDAGVKIEAIRQNLGHSNLETTLGYIGALDVEQRKPPQIFDFNRVLGSIAG